MMVGYYEKKTDRPIVAIAQHRVLVSLKQCECRACRKQDSIATRGVTAE